MTGGQRAAVELIARMLEPHNLRHEVKDGGKHLSVVVTAPNGGEHRIVLSSSPRGDEAARLNWVRQDVNALLDRIGVGSGRGQARRSTQRARRRRAPEIVTRHVLELSDGNLTRDPWEALKGLKL